MPTARYRHAAAPLGKAALRLSIGLPLSILLATSLPSIAEDDEEAKPSSTLPALDVLPEGSILRGVSFPRYDKNYKPAALLTADVITVMSKTEVQGKGIGIQLFHPTGKPRLTSHLKSALYNHKSQLLKTRETVSLNNDDFSATGNGLIMNWKDQQGILIGPVTTTISQTDMKTTMIHPPLKRPALMATLSSLFVTLCTAAPPAQLTDQELAEMDRLLNLTNPLAHSSPQVEASIQATQTLDFAASKPMHTFLENNGLKDLIVFVPAPPAAPAPPKGQAPAATPANPPANPKANKPATKPGADKKPEKKPKQHTKVKASCEGGFYFDPETGIFAYLKNVKLDVSVKELAPPKGQKPKETKFKLSCRDELKVFIEPQKKETDPKKKAATDKKTAKLADPKKADTNLGALSSFGKIKSVLAKGSVRITSTDDKGKTFVATAETASFDAKTEEIILRGGSPRLEYGPKNYIQARQPNLWIRIKKGGKVSVQNGSWDTHLNNE